MLTNADDVDDDMLDAVAADAFEPFEVLAGASLGNSRAAYSSRNLCFSAQQFTILKCTL